MKKIMLILLALTLLFAVSASAEESLDFLGKAAPDFTVTDIDGNTFTLSEATKDYEAVVINLWATWCGPCRNEFPEVNEVYEAYKDKVAFIALSIDPDDTVEKITDYRKEMNLTLPMGRDEGGLYQFTGENGIPTTLIVDRFGNVGFCQVGSFRTADELSRTIDTFLGDDYKETVVQYSIPQDTSTFALPVSAARMLYIDNPEAQKALINADGLEPPLTIYAVNGDVAHVRAEISAADSGCNMFFYNADTGFLDLKDMYDSATNTLVCDVKVPEDGYGLIALLDYDKATTGEGDPNLFQYYLVRTDYDIDQFVEMLKTSGFENVSWEFVSEEAAENENTAEAYVIYVLDQNGDPVPEVTVNFCTDTACVPSESDENGVVTFTGAPAVYHVQVVDYPEGYSCDESFEMYTPAAYGEWTIRLFKE